MSSRFFRFVVASSVAAGANIGSRIVFNLSMGYVPAIVLAFCVGLASAFVLNRAFVFREAINPLHYQAFWFVMVNLAALVQTLAISLLLVDVVFPVTRFRWHPETVAHVIGVGIPAITSYLGHKHFSFRSAAPNSQRPP